MICILTYAKPLSFFYALINYHSFLHKLEILLSCSNLPGLPDLVVQIKKTA